MRRLFTAATLIICIVALLTVGARFLGGLEPPNVSTALLALNLDESQPGCWHGICPSITTLEQAQRLLQADKTLTIFWDLTRYPRLCWKFTANNNWTGCLNIKGVSGGPIAPHDMIDNLTLSTSSLASDFHLGDAILLFGQPQRICLYWAADTSGVIPAGKILFQRNVMAQVVPQRNNLVLRLAPGSSVVYIVFASQQYAIERPWRGFTWGGCPPLIK